MEPTELTARNNSEKTWIANQWIVLNADNKYSCILMREVILCAYEGSVYLNLLQQVARVKPRSLSSRWRPRLARWQVHWCRQQCRPRLVLGWVTFREDRASLQREPTWPAVSVIEAAALLFFSRGTNDIREPTKNASSPTMTSPPAAYGRTKFARWTRIGTRSRMHGAAAAAAVAAAAAAAAAAWTRSSA